MANQATLTRQEKIEALNRLVIAMNIRAAHAGTNKPRS